MNILRYTSQDSSVYFWHSPIKFTKYDFSSLEDYYIDFTTRTFYKGPYVQGVPVLDYKGRIGKQFNPCAVAQYGLGCFTRFKSGDADAVKGFINAAHWLFENISVTNKNRGVWYYHFDLDAYNIKSPWYSALAQGQGVSLLLRAYLYTRNEKFLDVATLALNAMLHPFEKGGLLRTEGDKVYFEEVVSDRLTAILDGMIFSIFGLYDYYFLTKKHYLLLKKSVDTIKTILPQYDLGFWSRADLYNKETPMIASSFYHNLHVEQLKALFQLSGDFVFDIYSKKWDSYQKFFLFKWYAFIRKLIFKIRHY